MHRHMPICMHRQTKKSKHNATVAHRMGSVHKNTNTLKVANCNTTEICGMKQKLLKQRYNITHNHEQNCV